ncbi:MAG: outer membrane beta-barrel protein [Methylocystis sp.]|uniref:outer membrane protein n=2 Tax=Methylocystis sp. TaxID=1911079 RepID=UPI003D0F2E92
MKKRLLVGSALAAMAISDSVLALDLTMWGPESGATIVPKSGLSIGVGGNLNVATFDRQNFFLAGTSNNTVQGLNSLRIGGGYAGWNIPVSLTPQVRIAPIGQFNYFNHFGDSDWMWGVKGSYTYLNSAASAPQVFIPQFGMFEPQFAMFNNVPFFGIYTVGQFQARINHQFVLTPYLGRSFANGFFYVGGGPSLSHRQTNLNTMIGFRNGFRSFSGQEVNQTGLPANAQDSLWVFGGAATAGVTYFLTPSWYVDFNYTYSRTAGATSNYLGWYAATVPELTFQNFAVLSGGYIPASTSGALATQSFNVSLNWIVSSEAAIRKASAPATPAEPSDWRGAYAGLNIGAGWGANGGDNNNWNIDVVRGGYSNNLAADGAGGGVIGGGQIGYNWTMSPMFLVGAETDLQGTSLASGGGTEPGPVLNLNPGWISYFPGTRGGGVGVDWFGTLRGRAGVTLAPSVLLYGTGGFAYADIRRRGWGNGGSTLQTGWAAGGGVEWMFMPNWSAKAEYLYANVSGGNSRWNGNSMLIGLKDGAAQMQWNMLRAGVNYHFKLTAPPNVLASY